MQFKEIMKLKKIKKKSQNIFKKKHFSKNEAKSQKIEKNEEIIKCVRIIGH